MASFVFVALTFVKPVCLNHLRSVSVIAPGRDRDWKRRTLLAYLQVHVHVLSAKCSVVVRPHSGKGDDSSQNSPALSMASSTIRTCQYLCPAEELWTGGEPLTTHVWKASSLAHDPSSDS